MKYLTENDIINRKFWINEIQNLNGNFIDDTEKMQSELTEEIRRNRVERLLTHIRLCGNIPEMYKHDSSEEKLYSKYTDTILSLAFEEIGIRSLVLTERADAADVESFAKDYSFVSDAKTFRLSRTAKNQKDFKVKSMDGWKKGKPYAMVVCPIYQLPTKNSQIYQDASISNVCIFTYSHLALLVNYSQKEGKQKAENLLKKIFQSIELLNPSKSSVFYWQSLNNIILNQSKQMKDLWKIEKEISNESLHIAKQIDLEYLASERERFMRMSHQDAIKELIKISKLENKIEIISAVKDNGLFNIE
ncbi:MAG: HindIII family type II restriction endonuclease [Flavobacteriaceae bacterium]|nr:HindIII family type II restriction endonuclease [Flavobacteriaceae bacterium]